MQHQQRMHAAHVQDGGVTGPMRRVASSLGMRRSNSFLWTPAAHHDFERAIGFLSARGVEISATAIAHLMRQRHAELKEGDVEKHLRVRPARTLLAHALHTPPRWQRARVLGVRASSLSLPWAFGLRTPRLGTRVCVAARSESSSSRTECFSS